MEPQRNRSSTSIVNKSVDIVRALYPYTTDPHTGAGGGQLSFPEGAVLLVVDRADDGWCRGYMSGCQGWFPASYVQPITLEQLLKFSVDVLALNAVLRSSAWTVYATQEGKLYYVSKATSETSWILPSIGSPINGGQPAGDLLSEDDAIKRRTTLANTKEKHRKSKLQVVNGITYCIEGGESQDLMNPQSPSYIDYFWSDRGDQTGFDILREKHVQGKFVMKDMMEFFKERAAIEEQYARSLNKLSKSTFGDYEEGTLLGAWKSLKAELRERSEAHSKFANRIIEEVEKPMFEFKEGQKTDRKQHEQILDKSRKQVQALDAAIERAKQSLFGSRSNKIKRTSVVTDVKNGEDMKKLEMTYNQAQRVWMDNMIAACRDFERAEEGRSDFLKNICLKYIDLCVGVQEANAQALTYCTNMVDNINKRADIAFFIKRKSTGTQRPVDRVIELGCGYFKMADRRVSQKKQVAAPLTGHSFQKAERFPGAGRSVHGSDSPNWREPSKAFPSPTLSFPLPPPEHLDNVTFLHSRWTAIPAQQKQYINSHKI